MLSTEIGADLLVILSTIDGVFDKNPSDPNARIIHTFTKDTKKLVEFGAGSSIGKG